MNNGDSNNSQQNTKPEEALLKFLEVIRQLRDPERGCPWDLEQTHASLKPYVVEEAYEVVEAIDQSPQALCKELGDLLLQIGLHSQIASESCSFDFAEVINSITEKLIHRHPHVFGDSSERLSSASAVTKQWEQLKQQEVSSSGVKEKKGILEGLPAALPALMKAQRVSERAARVGFEWQDLAGVRDKILEEIGEFATALAESGASSDEAADEFGDVLFALIQLARRLNLNAEDLLHRSTNRFISRFQFMEQNSSQPLNELSLDELQELWQAAKVEEKVRVKQRGGD